MFVLKFFVFIWDALRDLVPFNNFLKSENTHGGVLLQFYLKYHSSMGIFFTFFKFYIWYQIAQSVSYIEILRKRAKYL